jgi:hypothetical protein
LPRNRGAVARNVGVELADTPYVAFADDDSWWAPGALERAADLFDAHPRLAVLAGRVLIGPEERLDPFCRLLADSPLGQEADLPGPSILGFLACAAVVRRDAFLAVGGFDPVVGFLGEEERVSLDLAAAGWGVGLCRGHHGPSPSAAHGSRPACPPAPSAAQRPVDGLDAPPAAGGDGAHDRRAPARRAGRTRRGARGRAPAADGARAAAGRSGGRRSDGASARLKPRLG